MSNQLCPHCNAPISDRDDSGGVCSRCGKSLFAFESPQAAATANSRKARRNASALSYWWVPLLAILALRACRVAARIGNERRGGMRQQQEQFDNSPRGHSLDRLATSLDTNRREAL